MERDFDLIETPEGVQLERNLAGIGSRFLAYLVDVLVILGITILLFVFFYYLSSIVDLAFAESGFMIALAIVSHFVLSWGYFTFYELKWNGQTPGKRSQRLRVVRNAGGPLSFIESAIRNLIRPVDLVLGPFCMFATAKWQRLGDLAAGTVVVAEQITDFTAKSDQSKGTRWQREVNIEQIERSGLSPEDYRVLENFWMRRHELELEARRRLMFTLVKPILERSGFHLGGNSYTDVDEALEMALAGARRGRTDSPPPPPSPGAWS